MDAAARLRLFYWAMLGFRPRAPMFPQIHVLRAWITALPACSTAAYGAALPRAAENATMQGFPRRAPTLTATGESDTVARGPALAPAFP